MKKLRIPRLRGYSDIVEIFRIQIAPFAEGMDPFAEFAYADAPSLVAGEFGWGGMLSLTKTTPMPSIPESEPASSATKVAGTPRLAEAYS